MLPRNVPKRRRRHHHPCHHHQLDHLRVRHRRREVVEGVRREEVAGAQRARERQQLDPKARLALELLHPERRRSDRLELWLPTPRPRMLHRVPIVEHDSPPGARTCVRSDDAGSIAHTLEAGCCCGRLTRARWCSPRRSTSTFSTETLDLARRRGRERSASCRTATPSRTSS